MAYILAGMPRALTGAMTPNSSFKLRSVALGAVVGLAAALQVGCSGQVDQEFADAVISSALQSDNNSEAGELVTDSIEASCIDDPALAASAAALRAPVWLKPSGCATKTANGAELHVDFNACSGPFGRMLLAGGVNARFSNVGMCQLHVDITDSGNLTSNGHALDYAAQADVKLGSDKREITWHADISGTSRRGKAMQISSDRHAISDANTRCVDVVGTAQGTVGSHNFSTSIEALSVCPGKCPSSGLLKAELEGRLRDRSLSIRFDGSRLAQVTGSNGDEFTVEMDCAAVPAAPVPTR